MNKLTKRDEFGNADIIGVGVIDLGNGFSIIIIFLFNNQKTSVNAEASFFADICSAT